MLGRAATGTGKTAAFSLPLLERHVLGQEADAPLVLVLTPTRELCLQVSEAFHNYGRQAGVVVTPIYGGQDYSRQIRALRRGTHVVVATPGRALDHIGRGTLDLANIKAIVLDEADEMLDLGFADELDAIFDALPGHVQTALFSATLPPKIARIAETRLVDPVRITIAKEKTAEGEAPASRRSPTLWGTTTARRLSAAFLTWRRPNSPSSSRAPAWRWMTLRNLSAPAALALKPFTAALISRPATAS